MNKARSGMKKGLRCLKEQRFLLFRLGLAGSEGNQSAGIAAPGNTRPGGAAQVAGDRMPEKK